MAQHLNDRAGLFVDVEGETALLGDPFFDGDDGTSAVGAVYV
jgi:hypothetical protein